ncbi:hypothetical protein NC653_040847 [Populus alba x Populus x berolinensis]|uniref:Uncharacterized protein n=1 Tax=Populus alba x Populus x berolinensis TaxID=444605 RepID=A0AAD6L725_9ROSI|nr:hypothetical protein NC653_040847 [Populus alba x Populus x berolinensis]
MGNKKNRSGPSKYQIKRQKSLAASHLVNNSAILALEARSSSETVHGTVHPISNSNLSPPMVSSPQSPCSTQHISSSSSHGSEPQHHDDSPSIKHVFVADWLEDEDAYPDDEALETNSVEEEYAGGFKFFTSPVGYSELAAFFQSVSAGLECLVSASLYFDKSSLLLLGRTTPLIGASLFHLYACSRKNACFRNHSFAKISRR